jgi:hypothetical protein
MSILPFLAARDGVSKYDVFLPDYTTPSEYRDACRAVTQGAMWVVIDRGRTNPDVLKGAFPTMNDPRPAEVRAFERALDDGFTLVTTSGSFELRRRRDGINGALCDAISG